MHRHPETIYKKNSQPGGANSLRFTTPLRKAFKRLHVIRKKPTSGTAGPLADRSNAPVETNTAPVAEVALEERLDPPPAPRPSRLASPAAPLSPISPLPPSVSRSGNLLTIRSKEANTLGSPSSPRDPLMSDDIVPEASSPRPPLPRGDLFQLGLTPVPLMRSIADSECPVFAPALPTVQRVSTVNMARLMADVDMMDVVNIDLDDAEQAVTPTPPSRNTSAQWFPNLASKCKAASNNLSTTAVFEGGHLAERRRSTFMSKLVGSAWGFTGLGFGPMNGHHRTQSAAPCTSDRGDKSGVMTSLPSIPIGKCSIERAVFGSEIVATTSKLSVSNRNSLVNGLAPANSTLRMTGSKSARALDHLDLGNENVAPGAKVEERPKKKIRASVANNFMRSAAPSPSSARVTRAMAARQAEIEANTPTRMTRSASKRLAELANSPTGKSNVVRSKSVKRL